ncbi:MAG TPA: 50S ribosomal protein L22 [Acidobacteriota bacterium]|nr:50S ribosomal protein L22 [Acidobacteriota bacterium]
MEAKAIGKYLKGSPQKARLVVDLVRGKKVEEALAILQVTPKRAAKLVEKVMRSALANAEHESATVNVDELFVKEIYVDSGPTKWRRRIRPAPQGRAYRQMRRGSHITVRLSDGKEEKEE